MIYADYEYYTTEYLGAVIAETDFNRLALRASEFVDYYTRGQAANSAALPSVKKAVCALAETYYTLERAKAAASGENGEIASQTVGSYSVSYRSGAEAAASAESELAKIARRYLAGSGLLYRGGRCCGSCMHLTL